MSFTTVIIDDSEMARANLSADIQEFTPELELIGEADGVVSGTKLIAQHNPQIVFLDVEMGSLNGFDLIEMLGESPCQVIFVTGSKSYAVDAFKVDAIDYILKPVDPKLLIKAVKKAITNIEKKKSQNTQPLPIKITFHTAEEVRYASSDEIVRMQAESNYTIVYFSHGDKLMVTKTLKDFDQLLQDIGFIRVHQSHLINPDYVKAFVKTEGGYLLMKNGDQVSVSVRKRSEVLNILNATF